MDLCHHCHCAVLEADKEFVAVRNGRVVFLIKCSNCWTHYEVDEDFNLLIDD